MDKKIYLILDNIRSRENVGSIFRTADGAGVSKVYLCGITPTPTKDIFVSTKMSFVDKITKTALGAENYVSWEYRRNTWRAIAGLKKEGVSIIALEQTKNAKNIFMFRSLASKHIALVLGNEVKGISPKILKYCDTMLNIPMLGKKESLNVGVAAGIALYVLRNNK
ncbi:MAG: hypothetical protein A2817_00700 [Candidatus Yanofskybacteria bacterium RIFCSPHIGHO2_01_FULL_39_8b]|uniref:tRNA/rRNA methyltransferase SpoU type domain-containing protein n=1 Tax=Candidatus Yanofskybacteria bacterium RIFCSPHIGHO2_01_FULL_39_8b TaxID=1802659 RepID=A0A1F8EAQ4_9BACT|nr:MAG: hypothetical protein A2817_00700 [Candidatus Yanofskybacteria bacterium RIFCSPHIGHO2_01_FULL_39_8b]